MMEQAARCRADTQVVRINPSSGRLEHDSRQGVGNFVSEVSFRLSLSVWRTCQYPHDPVHALQAEALDYLSDIESFEVSVFALFATFHYWIGKMSGLQYSETLGQIQFWDFF